MEKKKEATEDTNFEYINLLLKKKKKKSRANNREILLVEKINSHEMVNINIINST